MGEAAGTAATAEVRSRRLRERIRDYGSVCVGYSGGVDSVFLAYVALDELGPARVLAVTGVSPAVSGEQREAARRYAAAFGIPHLEVETGELADPRYARNGRDRCFYCKWELWERLGEVARSRGLAVLVDGTNADDLSDHRPGLRAGAAFGVRSPLAEVGLTKAEIRALSREYGLPTWDQPASPCLASRVVYGLGVTPVRLAQVERAEARVRALGFREFRVRHHGEVARLEFAPAELGRAFDLAAGLADALRAFGFARTVIDVEGYRRGALNGAVGGQDGESRGSDDRAAAAERCLAAHGLSHARVVALGPAGEIAAVRAPASDAAALARLAPELRAPGFRYVALDPSAGAGVDS